MKVQIVSRITAEPNARGNATYLLDVMDSLKRAGMELEFTLLDAPSDPPLRTWDDLPSRQEAAQAVAAVAEFTPDAVIVNYAYLAPILDALPQGVLKAILTIDVRSARFASFAAEGRNMDGMAWSEAFEASLLAKADLLIAIQPGEAAALGRLSPKSEVVLAPFTMKAKAPSTCEQPGRCLFVGSDADHNELSLRWFLTEVWPRVLTAVPEASLAVCGTIERRVRGDYPNTTFYGRVDDLTPHYQAAAACVVPLRVGSGLEIKLVEALAHAKPCVVSRRGLHALPDGCENAVAVGEDAVSFADALVEILTCQNRRRELCECALQSVREHFDPDRAHAALIAALCAARRASR